jgi:hypothetical protein
MLIRHAKDDLKWLNSDPSDGIKRGKTRGNSARGPIPKRRHSYGTKQRAAYELMLSEPRQLSLASPSEQRQQRQPECCGALNVPKSRARAAACFWRHAVPLKPLTPQPPGGLFAPTGAAISPRGDTPKNRVLFSRKDAACLLTAPISTDKLSRLIGTANECFNATPFDVENVFWSHRGEFCTFETNERGVFSHVEPTARLGRIAILWRGDEAARRSVSPETSRHPDVILKMGTNERGVFSHV